MSFVKYGLAFTCLVVIIATATLPSTSTTEALVVADASQIDTMVDGCVHGEHQRPANLEHVYALMDKTIAGDLLMRLAPEQIDRVKKAYFDNMQLPPMACFAPGTDEAVIRQYQAFYPWNNADRYNILNRWSNTANGGTGSAGDPITLTYSFVPDGTFIPSALGLPSATSNLQAWLNGIYGNPNNWQPVFADAFARWQEVGGIDYIFEPNDDGSSLNSASGSLGVRGDIRIAARTIDGTSNTLAYNNFPNDGDMVFDSADGFFNSTSSNSLRLRNVITHEHGHGQGLLHVCPFTGTKLMEPAIDLGFNGPQHDDIRANHRNYGDPFEPDNNIGQANDLGLVPLGTSLNIGTVPPPSVSIASSLLSIDNNGEQDYFRITTDDAAAIDVTVTPVGGSYDSSDQAGNGGCFSGNIIDSRGVADLAIQVLNSNGTQVLAEASANGLGVVESIQDALLGGPGDYYIRVYETGAVPEAQMYTLNIFVGSTATTPADFELVGGETEFVEQGVATPVQIAVTLNDATIVPGSPTMIANNGMLSFISMTEVQPNLWEADLPASDCGESVSYFFQFNQTIAGQNVSTNIPATAPGIQFSAAPVNNLPVLRNSGDDNTGWTVSGDIVAQSAGLWENGVPADGDRGDPSDDADFNNQAWLTGNATGNTDVDGGSTILTSPVFDLSSGGEIRYAYWLNDIDGTPLSGDSLTVEVATNGAGNNWTELRNYTTADDVWRFDTIDVGTEVAASSTMRVRFIASDDGTQTVVEAGVDAIKAVDTSCVTVVPPPPAPATVDATDGTSCVNVTVSWSAVAEADDYDVFRNTVDDEGSATLLTNGVVATSFVDMTAMPNVTYFYFVRGCNAGGGCGDFGPSDSGERASLAGNVTGLTATDDQCGTVNLAWDAVAGAFFYEVFRATTDDFAQASSLTLAFTNSLVDNTAPSNQTLYYWVATNNQCGTGPEGDSISGISLATPAAVPGNVMATADMGGTVSVSWDAVVGATSYDVLRNTVDDAGSATFLSNTAMLSFDDATAPSGQTLFYYVGGLNPCGDGPLSAGASVSTGMTPNAPDNVAATDGTCAAITVTWDAVSGATDYEVFRNTIDDFGSASSLGTTASTSFDDMTAITGTTYFYFVTATNVVGTSGASASAQGDLGIFGDLNGDGFINSADIQGFVDAILTTGNDCADLAAPAGVIDLADADAFVQLLLN